MSLVHAVDLQVGDRLTELVTVTSIEKTQDVIKVWTNHQFVPKCFEPDQALTCLDNRTAAGPPLTTVVDSPDGKVY